jgi:hypothetical protein
MKILVSCVAQEVKPRKATFSPSRLHHGELPWQASCATPAWCSAATVSPGAVEPTVLLAAIFGQKAAGPSVLDRRVVLKLNRCVAAWPPAADFHPMRTR